MVTPRNSHTATLLRDGTVLVAGGIRVELVAQAELYDPASGSWTATATMVAARYGHTATLLRDGTLLVTGGIGDGNGPEATAEQYDPHRGTWTPAGTLAEGRTLHTATLLPDGRVLVAGGGSSISSGGSLASAELYDPGTRRWTATSTMIEARYGHTATLLLDGTVLVTGGVPIDADHVAPFNQALASAELYDPTAGSWTATGKVAAGRSKHTATLLLDGTVLATRLGRLGSAELYDSGNGSWTATGNMNAVRVVHTATLLLDGTVLVAGGYGDGLGATLRSAELYDPTSGSWTDIASMATPRESHTATLLPDGRVLVVGGSGEASDDMPSAELYHPRKSQEPTR